MFPQNSIIAWLSNVTKSAGCDPVSPGHFYIHIVAFFLYISHNKQNQIVSTSLRYSCPIEEVPLYHGLFIIELDPRKVFMIQYSPWTRIGSSSVESVSEYNSKTWLDGQYDHTMDIITTELMKCAQHLVSDASGGLAEDVDDAADGQDAAAGALADGGAELLELGGVGQSLGRVLAVEVGDAGDVGRAALGRVVQAAAGLVGLALLDDRGGGQDGGEDGGESQVLHFEMCCFCV